MGKRRSGAVPSTPGVFGCAPLSLSQGFFICRGGVEMHPRGCGCVKTSKKKRDVLILCQLSDAVRSAKEKGRGGLPGPTQTTGDLPMQSLSSKKTALVCVTWASHSCEGSLCRDTACDLLCGDAGGTPATGHLLSAGIEVWRERMVWKQKCGGGCLRLALPVPHHSEGRLRSGPEQSAWP